LLFYLESFAILIKRHTQLFLSHRRADMAEVKKRRRRPEVLMCSEWKVEEWGGTLAVLLRAVEASGHIGMSGFSAERAEEAERLYNKFWSGILDAQNALGALDKLIKEDAPKPR
jgi:hypothetical protein